MTKKEMEQIYVDRIKAEAKDYVDDILSDVKAFMTNDEYQEASIEMINTFIAGANCAKCVLWDIRKEVIND